MRKWLTSKFRALRTPPAPKWPNVQVLGFYDDTHDIEKDIQYGARRLPQAISDIFQREGVSFETCIDFITYKDQRAELFKDIGIIEIVLAAQANAMCLDDGKIIFVPQISGMNHKEYADQSRVPFYVAHEAGHVLEHVSKKHTGVKLSDYPRFKEALANDLRGLTDDEKASLKFHEYVDLQSEESQESTRSELFAQLFADCVFNSITPSRLMASFPQATRFVERVIRNPAEYVYTQEEQAQPSGMKNDKMA